VSAPEEKEMDRELEFVREQVGYLERMVENCMAYISSLETRVAELERRPVAILTRGEGRERERIPHSEPSVDFFESAGRRVGARSGAVAETFVVDWELPRRRR
jgi:hypothetical protein